MTQLDLGLYLPRITQELLLHYLYHKVCFLLPLLSRFADDEAVDIGCTLISTVEQSFDLQFEAPAQAS